MAGVLDDGDDVGAAGGHVDQVAARAVRELDGVDGAGGADDVGDVRYRGAGGGTEVEHLGAGLHVDAIETAEDTRGQLAPEGVPDPVFGLGGDGGAVLFPRLAVLDRDALLAVDGLARDEVGGGEEIFLTASCDEDAWVTVGFLRRYCVRRG